MCNKIHAKHEAIPKHGFGWKIFRKNKKGYTSLINNLEYKKTIGKIIWDETNEGDGFCLFLSRNEARRVLRFAKKEYSDTYKTSCIRKIEYWGGLCSQEEDALIDLEICKTALCKSFEIIEVSKG